MKSLLSFRFFFAAFAVVCSIVSMLPAASVHAATERTATVGQPAPGFTLPDLQGQPVKLADFAGKWVVLEWVNPECPFVQKHYHGNMQGLQKDAAAKNVVWLAINSTNPGHPDFKNPTQMGDWMRAKGGTPRAVLFDRDGVTGRAYDARTTPHMYLIDPAGKLVYAGAIDDKRSARVEDIKTSRNHVRAALDEVLAGKPVSVATSTAYGCSIKYTG